MRPLGCGKFYGRNKTQQKTLIPLDPNFSEDEALDDDDEDPDYVPEPHDPDTPGSSDEPAAKRKCTMALFEKKREEEEEEEEEKEEEDKKERQGQEHRQAQTQAQECPSKEAHNLEGGGHQQSPTAHLQPRGTFICRESQQYFHRFFSPQLIKHIIYQTNLSLSKMLLQPSPPTNTRSPTSWSFCSTWGLCR